MARGRASVAALVALAGCQLVFPLRDRDGDAGIADGLPGGDGSAADQDADTVPDTSDNCPKIANVTQEDDDGDGIGDVCDNCPGIANPLQENTTDATSFEDEIGDACDPRPDSVDCLVLFEGFNDPSRFLSTWQQIGGASDPVSFPNASSIAISVPANASNLPIAWKTIAPAVQGAPDILLQGRLTASAATTLYVGVAEGLSTSDSGYQCVLIPNTSVDIVRVFPGTVGILANATFMGSPTDNRLAIVFRHKAPSLAPANDPLSCSIRLGGAGTDAVGTDTAASRPAGGVGFVVKSGDTPFVLEIDSITLYEQGTSSTCSTTPVIR
ncbi:MAG TPA: thrombospondin type 3 repeat-containing protein [Kofleriaceae bacterium]|nr:thrombospondin type 3 repeat-containing protein [Kofleriaceae bacterium]